MIFQARIYAGDALLKVASVLSVAGRRLLGNPVTRLEGSTAVGAREVELDRAIPRMTPALRLGGDTCEVVKVVSVAGRRVRIDRPLAFAYPKGSTVAVLV